MFDANAPEYFDLAEAYDQKVKPIMDEMLKACDDLGIPVVMMFSVGADDMDNHMTRFNVTGAVLGHLYRMPTEMMLVASLIEPSFTNALAGLYRDYLTIALRDGFNAGNDQTSRTSYRSASAYIASQIAVREAEERLHKEIDAADHVISLFSSAALHDYTMNGGTAHA